MRDRPHSTDLIKRLLSGRSGLTDQRKREIFATAFPYLQTLGIDAGAIFEDILRVMFNTGTVAALHVEHLKGADGEIALRIGDNEPFGLINVGDAPALCKLCEEQPELVATEKEFSGSLFRSINAAGSTLNILIGSKKFTEGWNSWRVSTMGLMNIGRSEGSEIIQLFGRGVRLKGHNLSLKRSTALDGITRPKNIRVLETLNIFGIRADYMRQFKEYLEEEGIPSNEERIEFVLPVVKNLNGKKLTSIRLQPGKDFKLDGPNPVLEQPPKKLRQPCVTLNWYPRIQARQSGGVTPTGDNANLHEGKLESRHLAFMDLDRLWFELQEFKNERAWHNLDLPREAIFPLLRQPGWYRLYIPPAELEFDGFSNVRRWEEIALALLKKYIDRLYKYRKQEWEADFLEYHEMNENDPNFIDEYRLSIEESQEAIVDKLRALEDLLKDGKFSDWAFGNITALRFGQHLYQPLLHIKSELVKVSPVSLNDGEKTFVTDLRTFYDANPTYFENREMYLLRNMSRGRGIGFFEAGNFYPDFILWLITKDRQFVTFVDPKGIRNLDGKDDPKIRFHQTIKELEDQLGDPAITLNSFIISNTSFNQVSWWTDEMGKDEFTAANVLFQKDDHDTYIRKMLEKLVSTG